MMTPESELQRLIKLAILEECRESVKLEQAAPLKQLDLIRRGSAPANLLKLQAE